jgi:hypothetical protein
MFCGNNLLTRKFVDCVRNLEKIFVSLNTTPQWSKNTASIAYAIVTTIITHYTQAHVWRQQDFKQNFKGF